MLDWQEEKKKTASLTIKTAMKPQLPPVLLISNQIDPRLGWRSILPTDEGLVLRIKAQTHSHVSWAMYKMSRGPYFWLGYGRVLTFNWPCIA